ncbi:type I-E CRISPR-associated protein Cas5/CasD [Saccharopolyspora sp. NPDC047091]|uniref:type I-E CRISPR-associated protein Cas5/CasD n=1 Tax=Saccharopolyspora sp. NPDC047091 TaxID=3155924 RepID=UPI0033F06DCF
MSGFLLRLAGPMQSWGERSAFDMRDTAAFPTRSGLLGLLACVLGRSRGESLDDLAQLSFTIRIDRPGVRMIDYQTTGGALPVRGPKVPTADGKGRPNAKGTLQTWREYLADAVFIVAVTGPDEILDRARAGLLKPRWQPFLGRRSCPPDAPLLLDRLVSDPIAELRTGVPLARRVSEGADVEVDFLTPTGRVDEVHSEIHDVPITFATVDRAYRPRPVWRHTESLDPALGVRDLRDYPARLADYVRGETA